MKVEQRGFTLVEVMVAITILIVVILGILQTMTWVSFKHMEVKEKMVALNIAQATDAILESMEDVSVVNPDGTVSYIHDKEKRVEDFSTYWLPVVLAKYKDNYVYQLDIKVNNVVYRVRAFAILHPVEGMRIDASGKPEFDTEGPYEGEVLRDLITVSYVISWKMFNGKEENMVFMRRYFKKGAEQ